MIEEEDLRLAIGGWTGNLTMDHKNIFNTVKIHWAEYYAFTGKTLISCELLCPGKLRL